MDPTVLDYLRQKAPELFQAGGANTPDPMGGFGDLAQRAVAVGQDIDPAFAAAQQRDIQSSQARTLGDYLTRGATLGRAQPVPSSAPPVITHENVAMYGAQQQADTARLQKIVNAMQALREGQMAPADVALRGAQAQVAGQQAKAGEFNLEDTSRLRTALAQGDSNATAFTRAAASKLAGSDPALQASIAKATGQELMNLLPTLEKAYAAEQARLGRVEAMHVMTGGGSGGGGGPLSDEALDLLARKMLETGEVPRVGGGMTSTALQARIATRAAQIAAAEGPPKVPGAPPTAPLSLAQAGGTYKANVTSLGSLQKQADAVNAFERTGLANLDLFLEKAKQIVDTGSPLFNMGARRFAQQVAGDPRMAGFVTARQVAVQEIAKILSGNMGNMALSDSARKEASDLLQPDASLKQIVEAANVLRRDLANRKAGFAAQVGEIRTRMAPRSAQPAAAEAPAPTNDPLGIR